MKKCGCPRKPTGWLSNRIEVEHTKECISEGKKTIKELLDLIKTVKISITPEMKQRFLDNLKARNKKK